MILGIDVSTSHMGLAILGRDAEILFKTCVKIKAPSTKTITQISLEYKSQLQSTFNNYEIRAVYIEEIMRGGSFGTSQNTILRLAQINAVTAFIVEEMLGIAPGFVNVNTARKLLGVKKSGAKKAKMDTLEKVLEIYPAFEYGVTSAGNPVDGTLDIVDAIVVARAGLHDQRSDSEEEFRSL
jgi:Holliday junction resolvasome RuvABC endonuclease subunit